MKTLNSSAEAQGLCTKRVPVRKNQISKAVQAEIAAEKKRVIDAGGFQCRCGWNYYSGPIKYCVNCQERINFKPGSEN